MARGRPVDHDGPLMLHVQGFRAELEGRGFAPTSVEFRIRQLKVLNRWMIRKRLAVRDLDAGCVVRLVASRRVKGRVTSVSPANFALLLGYLRDIGAVPAEKLRESGVARPSEKALRDLRRRLGPAPFKALFEVVAGPLAQPHTPGARFAGLRTVAFDGCKSLRVPDTDANRSWLGRIKYRMGWAGYPTIGLMTLVETGTRGLLGAVMGSDGDRDEPGMARRLLHLLRPGMLVLLDRGFDSNRLFAQITGTGAMLLCRAESTRNPTMVAVLSDGSYLSNFDGLAVRVIEAEVTMTGADGSRVGDGYRLITTLLDHHRFPAHVLIRLYHERWEIEVAYLALRHTLLDGHVLRSGDRPGLEQEMWALLTVYQLLRTVMVTAVETRCGVNPDRASFTTALETAREQLTAAGLSACAGSSAPRSWKPFCPNAAHDTAPARSKAATTATPPAARTPAQPRPPRSPRSTSPSTPPRPNPNAPNRPGRHADPPHPACPCPAPAVTAQWKSCPPSPTERGPAASWPSSCRSNPETC